MSARRVKELCSRSCDTQQSIADQSKWPRLAVRMVPDFCLPGGHFHSHLPPHWSSDCMLSRSGPRGRVGHM